MRGCSLVSKGTISLFKIGIIAGKDSGQWVRKVAQGFSSLATNNLDISFVSGHMLIFSDCGSNCGFGSL